jgi:molybdopterin-guanine dinucleotide biosynthesis protein A
MSRDVMGAVLAGGLGRRIGGDKPSLSVGDQTLVRHAVDALRRANLDVVLVLRPDQPVPLTSHTAAIVRDQVESAGPLGGLHALLTWLPTQWALVIACDQPFLSPALLQALLAETQLDIDVVCGRPGNALEPFPGLYRRSCLPAIEEMLARGARSLQDFLAVARTEALPLERVRRWDPELLSYLNVNTPDDLAGARAIAARLSASPGRCNERR